MHDYDLHSHASMIQDTTRVDAYLAAMRCTIAPGAVVVDIGTGTGFFAVAACQLGAARVYAIEPGDSIEVARAVAAANGCADRITFFRDLSTSVNLPERADVIVSDLNGVLPWFETHMRTIVDARSRFLKPGGRMIPAVQRVWVAPVSAPLAAAPAQRHAFRGVGLRPIADLLAHRVSKVEILPDQLLAEAALAETVDQAAQERGILHAQLRFTTVRSGICDGLGAWFDATLADGVEVSNAPGKPRLIYGQALFPFPAPVELEPGDVVEVLVAAHPVPGDYVWRWNTHVERQGVTVAQWRQSDFAGQILSADGLRRIEGKFVPSLSAEGQETLFVLQCMNEGQPLNVIADGILGEFPGRYHDHLTALAAVARVSRRYSC